MDHDDAGPRSIEGDPQVLQHKLTWPQAAA